MIHAVGRTVDAYTGVTTWYGIIESFEIQNSGVGSGSSDLVISNFKGKEGDVMAIMLIDGHGNISSDKRLSDTFTPAFFYGVVVSSEEDPKNHISAVTCSDCKYFLENTEFIIEPTSDSYQVPNNTLQYLIDLINKWKIQSPIRFEMAEEHKVNDFVYLQPFSADTYALMDYFADLFQVYGITISPIKDEMNASGQTIFDPTVITSYADTAVEVPGGNINVDEESYGGLFAYFTFEKSVPALNEYRPLSLTEGYELRTATPTVNSNYFYTNYMDNFEKGHTYTVAMKSMVEFSWQVHVTAWTSDKQFISNQTVGTYSGMQTQFTVPYNATYIRISARISNKNIIQIDDAVNKNAMKVSLYLENNSETNYNFSSWYSGSGSSLTFLSSSIHIFKDDSLITAFNLDTTPSYLIKANTSTLMWQGTMDITSSSAKLKAQLKLTLKNPTEEHPERFLTLFDKTVQGLDLVQNTVLHYGLTVGEYSGTICIDQSPYIASPSVYVRPRMNGNPNCARISVTDYSDDGSYKGVSRIIDRFIDYDKNIVNTPRGDNMDNTIRTKAVSWTNDKSATGDRDNDRYVYRTLNPNKVAKDELAVPYYSHEIEFMMHKNSPMLYACMLIGNNIDVIYKGKEYHSIISSYSVSSSSDWVTIKCGNINSELSTIVNPKNTLGISGKAGTLSHDRPWLTVAKSVEKVNSVIADKLSVSDIERIIDETFTIANGDSSAIVIETSEQEEEWNGMENG